MQVLTGELLSSGFFVYVSACEKFWATVFETIYTNCIPLNQQKCTLHCVERAIVEQPAMPDNVLWSTLLRILPIGLKHLHMWDATDG